jgi:hypothetical protein
MYRMGDEEMTPHKERSSGGVTETWQQREYFYASSVFPPADRDAREEWDDDDLLG